MTGGLNQAVATALDTAGIDWTVDADNLGDSFTAAGCSIASTTRPACRRYGKPKPKPTSRRSPPRSRPYTSSLALIPQLRSWDPPSREAAPRPAGTRRGER